MKVVSLLFRRRWLVISIGVLSAFVLRATVWQQSVQPSEVQRQQFVARITNGLGSAIRLAAPGNSIEQVNTSVGSTASFLYNRSNLTLAETTKERIAELEHQVLTGAKRYITASDLTEILTHAVMDRAALLTDDEIKHAVETARGFDAPDLPSGFRLGRDITKLRAHSGGPSPESLTQQLVAIRDTGNRTFYEGVTRAAIDRALRDRLALFSEAAPTQWGGAWNPTTNSDGSIGISPHQAIILVYSIGSDDYLADSITNLRARMNALRQALAARVGAYLGAEGHFAYGVNGYFHSAPIDLMFDVATMGRLLDRIDERSRR